MLFCAVGLNEPLGNRFLFVFFLFSANTSFFFFETQKISPRTNHSAGEYFNPWTFLLSQKL